MRAGTHYRQYQGNGFQESSVFKSDPDKRSPLPLLPQSNLPGMSVQSKLRSFLLTAQNKPLSLFMLFVASFYTDILEVIIKHEGRNRDHSNKRAFIINFQKVR